MRKYGWKIGDRVTLRSTVWPVDLDFRIVGEIANDARAAASGSTASTSTRR